MKQVRIHLIARIILVLIFSAILLGVVQIASGSSAAADGTFATRTLPSQALPVERFTVHITTNLVNGAIEEKLPEGFLYAGVDQDSVTCTMIDIYREETNVVEFVYLGALGGQCTPDAFSYKVIASNFEGVYTFSGTVTDSDEDNTAIPVDGSREVTVQSYAPIPDSVNAVRTLPDDPVEPGEQFEVTLSCSGIEPGGVIETLPEGFTYVDGSESEEIDSVHQEGRDITFAFMEEFESFTYEVVSSSTPGTYYLNGVFKGTSTESGTETTINVSGDKSVKISSVDAGQLQVTTQEATAIKKSSVVLNGNLQDMGVADSVTVSFEYGTTGSYGNTISAGQMSDTGPFTANLSGLNSDTKYHFRAKASGGLATAFLKELTVTTGKDSSPPTSEPPASSPTPVMYQLEVVLVPIDGGPVSLAPPGGQYVGGTIVELTAIPAEGYTFEGWGGDISGSNTSESFIIGSQMMVHANFSLEPVEMVPPTTTTSPPDTSPPETTEPPKTTSSPGTGGPSEDGPKKTTNISHIGGEDDDGDESSDENGDGGGTNIWVIIGPILGIAIVSSAVYYLYLRNNPVSTE